MKERLPLLEHINEVLKQWITDPEVETLVIELTDLINKIHKEN